MDILASITTILLFFIYLWGLGFTATYFVRKPEHFLERFFLNLGIGLGLFPILAILLNLVLIPLDWKIFLGISLAFPLFILAKSLKEKKLKRPSFALKKSDLAMLLVVFIALLSFYVYAKGAFGYPYLEDEDPWGHAVGAKYVALEKNAYDPVVIDAKEVDLVLSYIDPYPPAYDVLMGILHQTSPNVNWTLKFFNALIISLGFIFFYLFSKKLIGHQNKALFATFVLAVVPSYLSHFIWAHSLVVTIFFPAMYAFISIEEDKKWSFIALLLVASIWVSQNVEQPLKLSTMIVLYIAVFSLSAGKFLWRHTLALAGGVLLSFSWWGVMIQKYSLSGFLKYFGGNAEVVVEGRTIALSSGSGSGFDPFGVLFSALQAFTNPGGSASRAYTFGDFVVAQGQNMINNPIGVGMVLSLLTLLGVIYLLWHYKSALVQKENAWRCLALFWLVFAFWAVNGLTFPVSVARGAFRAWMIMAIPTALVAAEGFYFLGNFKKSTLLKYGVFIIVVIGLISTSGVQKYQLNTAVWPTSGSFTSPSEPFQYAAWFDTIPDNTKVFLYSPRDKLVIGYGKFSCDWCQEVIDFRKSIPEKNAKELYTFLKRNGYEYFIINGPMDFKYFSATYKVENTEEFLHKRYQEFIDSGYFLPAYQAQNSFMVLKVK